MNTWFVRTMCRSRSVKLKRCHSTMVGRRQKSSRVVVGSREGRVVWGYSDFIDSDRFHLSELKGWKVVINEDIDIGRKETTVYRIGRVVSGVLRPYLTSFVGLDLDHRGTFVTTMTFFSDLSFTNFINNLILYYRLFRCLTYH